jgi:putative hemolysin
MVLASTASSSLTRRRPAAHIIDVLIEERAPNLAASPLWPVLRPLLYPVLGYRKARRMADAIAPMPGRAALEYCSALLGLKVEAVGLERVPASGRVILIANHPTGIADGVALYDVAKTVRPDVVFFANADAHRIAPRFEEVLIPVDWVDEKRTRERLRLTLTMTREAMESERALAIFPAGRIARRGPHGELADPTWAPSALSIARKYDAPIAPVHVDGPWSSLFHFFDGFSKELRDITVFHELLNKRGGAYRMIVGPLISPRDLPQDVGEATLALKRYIETRLPADPERPFA